MSGPLRGIRVVEMAAIGPVPFACMVLSDLGAEVIRVDRVAGGMSLGANPADIPNRGRRSIAVDLKRPDGIETILKVIETADILVEGFRPGVMEKLGLGPAVCLRRQPRLVFGRGTGWGQDGPLSQAAGHDINFIVLKSGARSWRRPMSVSPRCSTSKRRRSARTMLPAVTWPNAAACCSSASRAVQPYAWRYRGPAGAARLPHQHHPLGPGIGRAGDCSAQGEGRGKAGIVTS